MIGAYLKRATSSGEYPSGMSPSTPCKILLIALSFKISGLRRRTALNFFLSKFPHSLIARHRGQLQSAACQQMSISMTVKQFFCLKNNEKCTFFKLDFSIGRCERKRMNSTPNESLLLFSHFSYPGVVRVTETLTFDKNLPEKARHVSCLFSLART